MITGKSEINNSYESASEGFSNCVNSGCGGIVIDLSYTPDKSTLDDPDRDLSLVEIADDTDDEENDFKPVFVGPSYIENKIKILLNGNESTCTIVSADSEATLDNKTMTSNCYDGTFDSTCDTVPAPRINKEKLCEPRVFINEDSCNAVDHTLSNESNKTEFDGLEDLSFNGKIKSISSTSSGGSKFVPTCELLDATQGFETTKEKSKQEKLNESFEMLTKEDSSMMIYANEKSPDLFADDDEEIADYMKNTATNKTEDITTSVNPEFADDTEKMLLKRLQASLAGVLPPPSVTISYIDITKMLSLYKEHESKLFYKNDEHVEIKDNAETYLCKPTHTTDEIKHMDWPSLFQVRAHGLSYNKSTTTEKFEYLGLKYVERYIGAETSSSFNMTFSPSSAKKRNLRMKMITQSPGSRLSHLAKRRAIFSSANLLTGNSTLNTSKVCNRQILLDPKKSENRRKNKIKTPKRRTPGRKKTPRRKTPSSSHKKKTLSLASSKPLALSATRETSKRALFQSPTKNNLPKLPTVSSEIASRAQKSKRALFSPAKRINRLSSCSFEQSDHRTSSVRFISMKNIDRIDSNSSFGSSFGSSWHDLSSTSMKRKRIDDDGVSNANKMARLDEINEDDLTPRSLKFARSQSFCVRPSDSALTGRSLFRANSEVTFPDSMNRQVMQLTENHKKKLLWAVSQSLQAKQIPVQHANFKQFAGTLARIVRKLFLEFNDHSVTSTSEKMLKLSNKHVYDVIQGKTVDDIYLKEKTRVMNAKNNAKLSGYIAPEEYENRKIMLRKSCSSLFPSENSSDSYSFSNSQRLSQATTQSTDYLSQRSKSIINSSSKNNENCTILRENIDSDQRQKSAQKQVSFSGKDQKNVSPYNDKRPLSKTKILVGGLKNSNILKAKRQISFE